MNILGHPKKLICLCYFFSVGTISMKWRQKALMKWVTKVNSVLPVRDIKKWNHQFMNWKCCLKAIEILFFLFITLALFFHFKGFKRHFAAFWIGEFVVQFFYVTNRLMISLLERSWQIYFPQKYPKKYQILVSKVNFLCQIST